MSKSASSTVPCKALIISVGGAPQPVVHSIREHQPAMVWYLCSESSRLTADEIHQQLDPAPERDFLELNSHEELGPTYAAIRKEIPRLLSKWRVHPSEVVVDYTGGTKTMSAALVLAATESFSRFSYIGGSQRQKAGVGVVIDGTEKVFYQDNPWAQLAVREIERAADLWNHGLFEAAASVLDAAASRSPYPMRFSCLAKVANGMSARRRLDFTAAVRELGSAAGKIPALYDGAPDHGLKDFVDATLKLCDACKKDNATKALLDELLDNALATAAQGRFEDAAARLYRAMELHGQIELAALTENQFLNGRCKKPSDLTPEIAGLSCCVVSREGDVKLAMEQVYAVLATLGHPQGIEVLADIDLGFKSRWRTATEKRNTSILAHGNQAVGEGGFAEMKKLASRFLQFDLDRERNPIPAFDPRWLELKKG